MSSGWRPTGSASRRQRVGHAELRVGGAGCAGEVALRYTETVVRRHKKHRLTVVIASRRYSLSAGHTATFTAGLNARGRSLLKTHGKLAARGTVTLIQANGKATAAAGFTLTLEPAGKHHHKKHHLG